MINKLSFVLALSCLAFVFHSCAPLAAYAKFKKTTPALDSFYVEVPLLFERGLPLLTVTIAGEPHLFALESGIVSVVDQSLADKIPQARIRKIGGDRSLKAIIQLDDLAIGGLPIASFAAAVIPFSDSLAEASCMPPFSGVIGLNAMKGAAWYIDYEAKKAIIASTAAALPIPDKAFRFPIETTAMGTATVEVQTSDGVLAEMKISTGSTSGFRFPKRQTPEIPAAARKLRLFYARDGQRDTFFYHFPETILLGGAHEVSNPIVSYRSSKDKGELGNYFLRHYTFVIDWPGEQMFLFRREASAAPIQACSCGFNYYYSPQDSRWLVYGLMESSSAETQGVRLGDEVISIDGVSFVGRSPRELCELDWNAIRADKPLSKVRLRRDGQELELELERFDWADVWPQEN